MTHLELFKNNFNDRDVAQYLHYAMKNIDCEERLEGKELLARMEAVRRKGICDPLHARGVQGWTPLHVAAIAGNRAGVCFLMKRGVQTDLVDEEGQTARDWAQMLHPELLPLFSTTSVVLDQPAAVYTVEDVVKTIRRVPLSTASFTYHAHCSDFGASIKRLLLPADAIPHCFSNMETLAQSLGFTLLQANGFYFVRDQWLMSREGRQQIFFDDSALTRAVDRCKRRAQYLKASAAFLTKHPMFRDIGVGAAIRPSYHLRAIRDLRTFCPEGERMAHFSLYIEGGDQYRLHNTRGVAKVLLGEDFLTINHHVALHKRLFEREPHFSKVKKFIDEQQALLTPERAQRVAGEAYAQGLRVKAESGAKELAARYLGTQAYNRIYMAEVLQVPAEDLLSIPQAAYHLDCFMRPGPKGSVFLQDYGVCGALLREMDGRAEALGLSQADQEILVRYRQVAKELDEQIGPLLSKVKQILEASDFVVIPTPGAFYDLVSSEEPLQSQGMNFLNAVTGWSDRAGSYFYIASGAQAGDHLGRAMMQAFAAFVRAYQPDTQVHFVGHSPEHPEDFSEAMLQMNDVNCQAGVHCFSFEFETASHTDP